MDKVADGFTVLTEIVLRIGVWMAVWISMWRWLISLHLLLSISFILLVRIWRWIWNIPKIVLLGIGTFHGILLILLLTCRSLGLVITSVVRRRVQMRLIAWLLGVLILLKLLLLGKVDVLLLKFSTSINRDVRSWLGRMHWLELKKLFKHFNLRISRQRIGGKASRIS